MRLSLRMVSIAVLVILLAIVGWVYVSSKSAVVDVTSYLDPQSELSEEPSSVVITHSAQTNAWKTFTDTENGFSFKYPSEFVPEINTAYPASGNVMVMLRRSSYGDWSVSVGGAYNNHTLDDAVKNFPFKSERNFQQKTLTVGGKEYQQLSYEYEGVTYISVYVPTGVAGYIAIDWKSVESISEGKAAQNSKEAFYALLSTFKLNKQ